MKPVMCSVVHNPPMAYGDCVRACVASIMEMKRDDVPHFYHDGCDGETASRRINQWLLTRGHALFVTFYPGHFSLAELLAFMGELNPSVHYMLVGTTTTGGTHMVVCRGGSIVHNPDHCGWSIIGPGNAGQTTQWQVNVIARL